MIPASQSPQTVPPRPAPGGAVNGHAGEGRPAPDQTRDFLRLLFGEKDEAHYFYVWTYPDRKSAYFRSIDEAVAYVEQHKANLEIYIGCALTAQAFASDQRIKIAEGRPPIAIVGFWSDIDFKDPGHKKEALPPDLTAASAILFDRLKPSLIVHTGGGVHCWWLFKEPWVLDSEAEIQRAAVLSLRWNRALKARAAAKGWTLDSVGDLSRVLRVPGTFNRKLVERPREVRTIEVNDLRINPSDAEEYLDRIGAQQITYTEIVLEDQGKLVYSLDAEPPAEKLAAYLENDKRFKETYERKRKDFQDQSPSSYDMALVNMAVAAHWTDQEAVNLCIHWRRKEGEEIQSKLRDSYFLPTLRKARALYAQTEERATSTSTSTSTSNTGTTSGITDTGSTSTGSGSTSTGSNQTAPAPPNIRKTQIVKDVSDYLMRTGHFARDGAERLYRFEGGVYVPCNLYLREQTQVLLDGAALASKWSSHLGREVVEYTMLRARPLSDKPSCDEINVQNGILDIWTGTLREHTPDFLSPVQIPVKYDPTATCRATEQFVGEVFPRDARDLAFEIFGDALTPDRSIQKAVLLVGEGGNGKGTFLTALIAFVGRQNVSTVPLHKLEEDRFSVARLYGKLVNCCADLPSDHLRSTSMFKALTGGDTISGERKHENSFDFTPYARLVFSANHSPRSDDASKAFFDRWLVVPFNQSFRGTNRERQRVEIDAALATAQEQSGVLNRALVALRRVRTNGRFGDSRSTAAALAEFQQVTDPLAVWLERATVTSPKALVPCAALLLAYNDDCTRRGGPVMSKSAFGSALRRLHPTIEVKPRGPKGQQKECYIGMGLKADSPQGGA